MKLTTDRLRTGLIAGAAILVVVSGIIGLYAISASSERNRETEILLYRLEANAKGLNSNEWEAIASLKIDAELRETSEHFRAEIINSTQMAIRLQEREGLVDEVQPATATYLSAMDAEFALIESGQLDAARELDDSA